MPTHINWFETGTSPWGDGSSLHVHEWEGIDNRFTHHHWTIYETVDPDLGHLYELFLCVSDAEAEMPAGLWESLDVAQRSAERINAVLFDVRSSS